MIIRKVKYVMTGLCIGLCMLGEAQDLSLSEGAVKLSKGARNAGSYFGGGFDHEKKQLVAIMMYPDKKEGTLFDVYRFDEKNNPIDPQVGLNLLGLAQNLNYESTDTDENQGNEAYDGSKGILVRSNFIGRDIIIERGKLTREHKLMVRAGTAGNPFHKSSAWMVDRLLFEQEAKEKIDMDMMPIGTLVSQGQYPAEVLRKIQEGGQQGPTSVGLVGSIASQVKAGVSATKAGLNAAFMREGGQAVVIGRVVEKVSIKDPVPWNNNRLRVATVDGDAMTAEEKLTMPMPFAFIPAVTEAIEDYQKMVALLVPLNSPNTVKEAKQYQMDKENRNRVMVVMVNAQGEVTDTLEYRSAGSNGKYAIRESGQAVFIPAVVDANKSGFYNGFVTKPTHFQITKIADGKVAFHSAYNFDEINDRVVVAKGEKFKKLKVGDITWQEHQEMENGDVVFFARDADQFYAFQVDQAGNLKHLYLTARYDAKGQVIDSKFIATANGKMVWMTRETPEGVADVQIDLHVSSSTFNNGLVSGKVTTATARPRNVMELKAVTKVATVDPATGTLGAQQVIGGKDYLVVGDTGFLVNEAGEMIMIGYDMTKKKTLHAIRLSN